MLVPLPLVKRVLHQDIFRTMYEAVRNQWNVFDNGILPEEVNFSKVQLHFQRESSAFGKAIDPAGPLTGPHYVREYLRWAADLNLIFMRLFWKIKEPARARRSSSDPTGATDKPLTVDELDRELGHFSISGERSTAFQSISKNVNSFEFGLPFRQTALRRILAIAIESAISHETIEQLWKLKREPKPPSPSGSSAAVPQTFYSWVPSSVNEDRKSEYSDW